MLLTYLTYDRMTVFQEKVKRLPAPAEQNDSSFVLSVTYFNVAAGSVTSPSLTCLYVGHVYCCLLLLSGCAAQACVGLSAVLATERSLAANNFLFLFWGLSILHKTYMYSSFF